MADLEHKVLDFLEEHRSSLDQETTFQLLASHGNAQALVKYVFFFFIHFFFFLAL
jgi:hypothetical protein